MIKAYFSGKNEKEKSVSLIENLVKLYFMHTVKFTIYPYNVLNIKNPR